MERKIGETFEFKGKTYEVAELPEYFCAFCDLEKECYSKRSYLEKVTGTCSPNNRKDTRSVCFKEIKNDMEIKDNQLTINIPYGMEIDVENCDLKNGIIKFKKKELRYEDIENYLNLEGNRTGIPVDDNNAFKLCATDRLMNIARYYNGDWKPDWSSVENKYYIIYCNRSQCYSTDYKTLIDINTVYFKCEKDAQAVIDNPNFREILDEIFKD
nr:MAG: hypothetical protein [Bacteriophage sp.]